MESVLGRYRNLIILVGVLFLQVLGLAMQVKRTGGDVEKTRLIRFWVVGAITPFERVVVWVENSGSGIWHNYFYLRGVRAENRELKEQIEQMRLEQVRLSEDAAQAHRLQTLLAFKEQFVSKTVAAQVVGSSGTDSSRVIYIDKGEDAGIRRDMAVITADGVVGKVLLVYPSVSQVLLINDQTSGVGVILGQSRLQGVLVGTANGEVVLNGVMSDEQVPAGETVLTSGGDQIFPKGLPVGAVTKVGKGKDLFLSIKIKPTADLSRLEEVLVLVEKQERQATADDNVHLRASDILAQRLPSVPDKPAADANAAKATPDGSSKQPVNGASTKIAPKPGASPPASQAAANPAGTGTVHSGASGPKPGKPVNQTATAPRPATPSEAITESKPDASPATPAAAPPDPDKAPSTPPPSQSQPPPDNASPN